MTGPYKNQKAGPSPKLVKKTINLFSFYFFFSFFFFSLSSLGNWLQVALLEQSGWTRWFPEVPSNLNYSVILS